jgi:hypothetical protein
MFGDSVKSSSWKCAFSSSEFFELVGGKIELSNPLDYIRRTQKS